MRMIRPTGSSGPNNPRGRGHLLVGEKLSLFQGKVADLLEIRGSAGNGRVRARAAINDLGVTVELGRHGPAVTAVAWASDGLGILDCQHIIARRAVHRGARAQAAWQDEYQVRPDALYGLQDGALGSVADGQQAHHGSHTDDDAQHGQRRAQLVGHKGEQRDADTLSDAHARSTYLLSPHARPPGAAIRGSIASSAATRPSCMRTTRRVYRAISWSWVTRMMVMPRSAFKR